MSRIFLFLLTLIIFISIPNVTSAQILTTDKLITVDIGKQRLYAWEGGRIQFETPVSTGMRYTPTVKGSFKIRTKVPVQDMKGSYPPYAPYYLKNVKHVQFFYGAYAIHGAHWHNSFGYRVSHGCVNLPPAAAEWLFNWTNIGTRVEIF